MKKEYIPIIGGAVLVATNLVNYLLTSYFIGTSYKNSMNELYRENLAKDSVVAEQKITLDSLVENFTKKQRALVDSIKAITERKNDYQKGIEILSRYLDKNVDVQNKIVEAYGKKEIKNGEAFRFIVNKIPKYKPKTPTKSSKKK